MTPSPEFARNPVALRLNRRAGSFARAGRLWFYADDLVDAAAIAPPRLVRLTDEADRDLGLAMTATAKIAVRRCGPWPGRDVPDRETFFGTRVGDAVARRVELAAELGAEGGLRLVHGEGDSLPGLVVDRYGPVLVLQITCAAVEAALDAIVPRLVELTGAESVVARDDLAARRHEQLPSGARLLHGRRVLETAIVEHGVRHRVRPFAGHKTGFYLDQRPARALVRQLAADRDVLDLFAYQGAFSLAALRGGARSAVAVDQSSEALGWAAIGAADNGLAGLETRAANAFELLRTERGRGARYGLIVLDPPPFAKSRREVRAAERGYRDLNRLALRLLEPGGQLLTCSCSHHVTGPRFEDVIRQAAAGLPFGTVLCRRLGAGSDHPVLVTHPESEYLKVVLLQRQA